MLIGDKVLININDDIVGTGEILGLAFDQPYAKSWIVLFLERKTDFLKKRPEKAMVIFETHLTKI